MNKEGTNGGIGFVNECWDNMWSNVSRSIPLFQVQERIESSLSLIPEDCTSILDVGCGNGRITNQLTSYCKKVVGLDSNKEGLKYVQTDKILGTMESLPFADRSFDSIICCEVLEHLPYKDFPKVLDELERVADRYIIISVPYKQNLRKSMVRCPYCGCEFVPLRHVRSFDLKKSLSLFGSFTAQNYVYCQWHKDYNTLVTMIARLLGLIPRFSPIAVCPQCGYREPLGEKPDIDKNNGWNGILTRFVRTWAGRLMPAGKKPTCISVIYRRK